MLHLYEPVGILLYWVKSQQHLSQTWGRSIRNTHFLHEISDWYVHFGLETLLDVDVN